jgi:hypothetical protein
MNRLQFTSMACALAAALALAGCSKTGAGTTTGTTGTTTSTPASPMAPASAASR